MYIGQYAWRWYKMIVVPSYVREVDIFATAYDAIWVVPKPEYAWIVMKALLLLKMELKDKPWICGPGTLHVDIDYIQGIIDSEV